MALFKFICYRNVPHLVNAAKTGKVLDFIHAEELLDLSAHARNAIYLAAASCLK